MPCRRFRVVRVTPLDAALAAGTLDAELIVPGAPTPTVPAAAAALGVAEAQILKSLLFVAPDGAAALAVVTGDSRVDRARLVAAAGVKRLKMAPPEVVLARTGYPAGGVPPVCHATELAVFVDRRVLALDDAYAGGGSDAALLRIRPAELVRAGGATVADIIDGPGEAPDV